MVSAGGVGDFMSGKDHDDRGGDQEKDEDARNHAAADPVGTRGRAGEEAAAALLLAVSVSEFIEAQLVVRDDVDGRCGHAASSTTSEAPSASSDVYGVAFSAPRERMGGAPMPLEKRCVTAFAMSCSVRRTWDLRRSLSAGRCTSGASS